jgi:hypothetical protein
MPIAGPVASIATEALAPATNGRERELTCLETARTRILGPGRETMPQARTRAVVARKTALAPLAWSATALLSLVLLLIARF